MRRSDLFALLLFACGGAALGAPATGTRATLAVLETTDLHANVLGYDYFKLASDPSLGLDRVATLIAQARGEFSNTLLLDDGDTIQGTALADYEALMLPLDCKREPAIFKAMRRLGFDGGSVGNHDFNYGLAYLAWATRRRLDVDDAAKAPACKEAEAFPHVLANVYSSRTRAPLFEPYRLIDKELAAIAPDGGSVKVALKVGIIGFTPPAIMAWDKRWLEGRVYTEGVREAAQRFIPEMRARGADLVVALSHGGLDGQAYTPALENANLYLAQVPGIDAMLMGHSHEVFPNAASKVAEFDLPGVDKVKGLVHGVPAVMAGLWGKQLGVIALQLRFDGKAWVVDKDKTVVQVRSTRQGEQGFVAADASLATLVAQDHAGTIDYVRTPVGSTDFRMSTYFADVGDVSAIEVVNQAQSQYLSQYVQANLPQYAALPVLSMAAPFKSGAAGPSDYTDVAPGSVALNNAADLYLYPNALSGVKVNGAELKAWLERAAERFNTIDPARSEPQELVNPRFPGFNFDALTSADVGYEIDLSKSPGQRIVKLNYKGAPVRPEQLFLVATNNFRANGGGAFPGLDGSKTVLSSPDTNRDVLIAYIKAARSLRRPLHGAHRSWHFAPLRTAGPVVFHSAPNLLALARAAGVDNIMQLRADDGGGKGFALYALDLSR